MKMLDTTQLIVGATVEAECYNSDGEMLIAKGITITQSHLEALRRRNIFILYVRESESDMEVEQILSKELAQLEVLEFDETSFSIAQTAQTQNVKLIELTLPELKEVKKGREGLTQLVKGKRAADIDWKVEHAFLPDRPAGTPLAETMTQLTPAQRSPQYKEQVISTYLHAVREVRRLLVGLTRANNIAASMVNSIVERLLTIFVTDKNIILNLGTIKPTGDDYIFNHSLNVCLISLNIAASAGYSEKQIIDIGVGALLHDLGMLLIPAEIRSKDSKLTPDEWFEVQKHPVLGLHLLERIMRLAPIVPIAVYQSHERENGSGYPRQRSGRLLHSYAKIIHCADVYEACSSPRSYRPAMPPYTCMERLVKMARQGLLSNEFVKSLLHYTSLFPVGSLVQLSDNRICRVISGNGRAYTKPIVSVLATETGKRLSEKELYQIDLKDTPDLQIVQSLPITYLEHLGIMEGF
jgi:HD-GYP domain-containing protein (c-di-GMP phosphodiesterase class II)